MVYTKLCDILGDAIEEFNLPELNSFKGLDDKTGDAKKKIDRCLCNYMIDTPKGLK
jgi:hypothetical protein